MPSLFPYTDESPAEHRSHVTSGNAYTEARRGTATPVPSPQHVSSPYPALALRMESVDSWSSTASVDAATEEYCADSPAVAAAFHYDAVGVTRGRHVSCGRGGKAGVMLTEFDELNARLDCVRERNIPSSLTVLRTAPFRPLLLRDSMVAAAAAFQGEQGSPVRGQVAQNGRRGVLRVCPTLAPLTTFISADHHDEEEIDVFLLPSQGDDGSKPEM
jgi:hypothetical protein